MTETKWRQRLIVLKEKERDAYVWYRWWTWRKIRAQLRLVKLLAKIILNNRRHG